MAEDRVGGVTVPLAAPCGWKSRMPKISLVVPCYNLAPWIGACLDSVREQGWTDWECIVVNDESTDNSAEILEAYAQQDARIKVVSQKNRGEGGARNAGLAQATGEWVFFLDGDDVLAPRALELAMQISAEYPEEDLIRFGYKVFEDGTREGIAQEKEVRTVRKDIARDIPMEDFYTCVWQHFYRRRILAGMAFMHYKRGCDRVFVDDVLLNRVNSLVETNALCTGYRQREGSAMHLVPSKQVLIDELEHRRDIIRLIEASPKRVPYAGGEWLEGYFIIFHIRFAAEKPLREGWEVWKVWYACVQEMVLAKGLSARTRKAYRLFLAIPTPVRWGVAWATCVLSRLRLLRLATRVLLRILRPKRG